ncbi:fibronectin type III domain-containing protein [Butyrivibrio sp. WCD2001]|uniref:fibronectin type III domain-containing protein n=1 Tax=Butyrivibrio sp. WCD2001 TaxID=1280681 RepID=UPI0009DB9D13|nr:fibronectin type III domain-containing protein [Butyrivibrio sp. WCD2001]
MRKKRLRISTKNRKVLLFQSLRAGKKSITISWKKLTAKDIKGYEIQYSTDKSFKKDVKTVNIGKTKRTSKTIKKLTSKKKYYVSIRTYKKSGGEKIYSKWSKSKSVKVK